MEPETLSRIAGLEVRARHLVEGYLAGLHTSPFHGRSVEFAEHRPYSPGDELKRVDWKLWARSDRFYVKLFEEETNLRAYFLLDASGSMAYRSGAMSKFDYGATLAAGLAYLLLSQQDAVGLTLFDTQVRSELPPSASPGHLSDFCRLLQEDAPGGETDLGPLLQQVAGRLGRRGLVVLVSDLLAPLEDVLAGLRRLHYDGHSVIVAHVLDREEVEFPFEGQVRFEGLEGGEVLADGRRVRAAYVGAMARFRRAVRQACLADQADYLEAITDRPLDAALARFLAAQAGGH